MEIPEKKIFEDIALNLAFSATWTKTTQFPDSIIENQKHAYLYQARGILQLLSGTYLFPVGTPTCEFMGTYLPYNIIQELETNKYWPDWYKP